MGGAVHRFHGPFLSLDLKGEHVVLVVQGVSGLVPEVEVEDVGGDDLGVSALPVLFSDEFDESVVYAGTVGKPEGGSRRQIVEHDEFLLSGDPPVITLLGLKETI